MTFTPWAPTVGNATIPLSVASGGTGTTGSGNLFWQPADDGFAGFNSDPCSASGGGLLIGGTAYLARLPVRVPTLISKLWVCVPTAGSGASTGSFIWIVSGSNGAVLAQSADCAAAFTGTQWQSVNMTAPVTVGGSLPFPYAVILSNLAVTQPTLLRQLNTVNDSPQATPAVSSLRWAQQAAFGTAVAAVTLASNAASGFSNIVGWS